MPQLAIAAAGAAIGGSIGGAFLGVTAVSWGWMAGSLLGSLLFAPDGPKAQMGDTRAPKIDFGSRMHRVYGTVRVPMSPRWLDVFDPTSQSAGGKGGGGESEFYTYTSNALYWVADGTNVEGFRRIWKNGELVYNNGTWADAESIAASNDSQHWSDITFFDGNVAQLPWSVYEAAVTAPQADAHRRIACIGVQGIECGNSPQLPFFEAEIYTNGADGDAIWRNHVRFAEDDARDTSYYDATPVFSSGVEDIDYSISDGTFQTIDGGADINLTWSGTHLRPQNGMPITIQAKGCMTVPSHHFTPSLYVYGSDTFFFSIGCNSTFGFDNQWRFFLVWPGNAGAYYGPHFGTGEMHHCELIVTPVISGATATSGTIEVYVDGVMLHSASFGSSSVDTTGYCKIYSPSTGFSQEGIQVEYAGTAFAALHTTNFTPPADLPTADGPTVTVGPEDLADVVSAECLRCHGVTAADFDVTDLAGVEVDGFICEGSAREAIEQLMAAYYFTAVPGKKVVFKMLDEASLTTIPAEDTGVGLDQASEMFAGLMRANDLELPAQVSITGPNPSADYDPATATSDRLVTVGNKIEQATWRVVFTPAEMKGRANANALDARIATHTATIQVSDKYAAYEIGDVMTHVDHEGNSYVTRWLRETYSQGVKSVDVRLFDRSILTLTGAMSDTYSPAIVVRGPAALQTALLLDVPIMRDADNAYGLYVTATGTGRWQGATVYKSADDATWVEVAQLANRGVIGTASELPDFTGWTWDDTSTLTVTLDEGSDTTLTSSTKAAIEADQTINAAIVGVHGRWEVINYVTATFVSGTTWTLSGGMLRGQRGTEHNNGNHAAGDYFVLLRTTGIARIEGDATDVGAARYYKVVPAGATIASVSSQSLTTEEQGLTPYAVVDIQNDAGTIRWNRRSRLSYAPLGVTQPPLGEDSESYDVDFYDGASLVGSTQVTSPETPLNGATSMVELDAAAQRLRVVGSDVLGVSPSFLASPYVARFDSSGNELGRMTTLTPQDGFPTAFVDDGTSVYVAAIAGPNVSQVHRIDPANIVGTTALSAEASYDGTADADCQGLAHDGTNLWVAQAYTQDLKKLDASTLSVVDTYSTGIAGGAMVYDSGSLWICDRGTSEIVEWDIGATSEVRRIPCAGFPCDVLIDGGYIYVAGSGAVTVHDQATGVELLRVAAALVDMFHTGLSLQGSNVVFRSGTDLVYLSGATVVDVIAITDLIAVSGTGAAGVYASTRAGLASAPKTYEVSPLGGDVTEVRVNQNSASVGRGHEASLTL
jgi:hypothetical protein